MLKIMPINYKEYNNLPWWGYTKIADNFPTFGLSASSRKDLINGNEPGGKKRIASFIIAAIIILALLAALIAPAIVLSAGGISAITIPTIITGVGVLGGAMYFGIKSSQNAKSLKRNLDLAEKRDKIIEVNKQYTNNQANSKIALGNIQRTEITQEKLEDILSEANDKFPDNLRLQKIYTGAKLLECLTSAAANSKKTPQQPPRLLTIEDEFKKCFALDAADVNIQDKNDALLASVAIRRSTLNNQDLKQTITDASHDFYNCDVSDNVLNITLNKTAESYYEDAHTIDVIKKFYDKNQAEKFGNSSSTDLQEKQRGDLFDKENGIDKPNISEEVFGSAFAALPIATAFYNVGKAGSIGNQMKEIQENNIKTAESSNEIFRSNTLYNKINPDFARLDSSGDGMVTMAECKAYAASKGITTADIDSWMKSYGITPPTNSKSITVESILMNKSLGKGFTDYVNTLSDKSAIDAKVFDNYSDAVYDSKSGELKITIVVTKPDLTKDSVTIVLDKNEIKRFTAATGVDLSDKTEDIEAFSNAVLAKYKVFATEIKNASNYEYKDLNGKMQSIKNPAGWQNYLNGLKKQNGFIAPDMTVGKTAIIQEDPWTEYEKFLHDTIPSLSTKVRNAGNKVEDVQGLVDALFDNPKIQLFLNKKILNGMTLKDMKEYFYKAGPEGVNYIESFSKYMHYSVQSGDANKTAAAKYLKEMEDTASKLYNNRDAEQFAREVFKYSSGDGTANVKVQEFIKSFSSTTKAAGNAANIFDDVAGGKPLSGEVKNKMNIEWTKDSRNLTMLGDNILDASPTKVGANVLYNHDIGDMNVAAAIGLSAGFGALIAGGGAKYSDKINQRDNQDNVSFINANRANRLKKDDDRFKEELKAYKKSAGNPASAGQGQGNQGQGNQGQGNKGQGNPAAVGGGNLIDTRKAKAKQSRHAQTNNNASHKYNNNNPDQKYAKSQGDISNITARGIYR